MADDLTDEPEFEAEAFSTLHPVFADAPRSVSFRKLRKRLVRQTQEAIRAYGMAPEGRRPRWLVCLSGGKDSYTLLSVLLDLQWQGALPVDLLACNLDQGQPGFDKQILPAYFEKIGAPFRIITQDTYSVVTEKVPASNTYCSLCSRMRRGILYRVAREEGCEAVATIWRDNLVRIDGMFYITKVPSLPELKVGTKVLLEIKHIDTLLMELNCKFKAAISSEISETAVIEVIEESIEI